jgi:hypothetical protein
MDEGGLSSLLLEARGVRLASALRGCCRQQDRSAEGDLGPRWQPWLPGIYPTTTVRVAPPSTPATPRPSASRARTTRAARSRGRHSENFSPSRACSPAGATKLRGSAPRKPSRARPTGSGSLIFQNEPNYLHITYFSRMTQIPPLQAPHSRWSSILPNNPELRD